MRKVLTGTEKMGRRCALSVCLLPAVFLLLFSPVSAAEHAVEKGETALQIAIDHDLTMDQLSQLNPGVDLEMMRVGDMLTVPDEGTSFDAYLDSRYAELLRITDLTCLPMADRHGLCLFHAENISDLPLFDVVLKAELSGRNGTRGTAESAIPLIQILPGEKLPVCMEVEGDFEGIASASVKPAGLTWSELLRSSFRIPEALYSVSDDLLPGGTGSRVTVRFTPDAVGVYREKKINVLAAAYAADGSLVGVRSLYSDLVPVIDLTVYSTGPSVSSVRLWLEAY